MPDYKVTVFYYNPNITEESEYRYRYSELKRYVEEAGLSEYIRFIEVDEQGRSASALGASLRLAEQSETIRNHIRGYIVVQRDAGEIKERLKMLAKEDEPI